MTQHYLSIYLQPNGFLGSGAFWGALRTGSSCFTHAA